MKISINKTAQKAFSTTLDAMRDPEVASNAGRKLARSLTTKCLKELLGVTTDAVITASWCDTDAAEATEAETLKV